MSADRDQLESAFDEILRAQKLETVFQPIVRLDDGETVGYEALVRGPAGSPLAGAVALLEQAYRSGRVVEFDWAARAAACRSALAAPLGVEEMLFLNIEPLALGSPCPPEAWTDIKRAFDVYQVVLEVTERSLARDPRSLLEGIDQQRPGVSGLAVDDLGADTPTLSMLPVLGADVIKLDLSITQAGPSGPATKVLDIAYEEAERTGAMILAEGVETDAHADFAQSVGAALGQGRYYGEPGPLGPAPARLDRIMHVGSASIPDLRAPFDALEGWLVGRADERLLRPLCQQVAYREAPLAEPAMVLVLVPEPKFLGRSDRSQLVEMSRRGVVVGALGPGLASPVADGVRGGNLQDHRLDGQWAVVALSPGTASAMLARARPGEPHLFEYGVTHDRRRVVAAARCLMRRLGPL